MVPKKDYYEDKDGNLTDDPAKYAAQVAVAGVELDERVAKKYGIEDLLVPVDEPNASRRVTFTGTKPNAKPAKETEPKAEEPEAAEAAADDAEAASPVVEKPKANKAKKPAKKGEKKK